MGRLKIGAVLGLILGCFATSANALIILDTASLLRGGSLTLGNFSTDQDPLGQTFTTTQSVENLVLGGVFEDVNDFLAPTFDVTISLVTGAGLGGAVLGSRTATLADGFSGLHTEDFSAVGAISPGTYTVAFSSGGTGRGALTFTQNGFDDPASDAYNENGLVSFIGVAGSNRDFRVRVTADPSISGVPIPGTAALLGLGLLGMRMRRRA